jgi:hypothetical protein
MQEQVVVSESQTIMVRPNISLTEEWEEGVLTSISLEAEGMGELTKDNIKEVINEYYK